MIWRILVFVSWLTVYAYVDKNYGREAAWAAGSVLTILLLPLSKIESRLGELVRAQRQRISSKERANDLRHP